VPTEQLGTAHGISQTSASFVRAVGPAIAGNIWTWSLQNNQSFPLDYHFMFGIMSIVSLIGFLLSFKLKPEDVERKDDGEFE
jgi:MFS family permease